MENLIKFLNAVVTLPVEEERKFKNLLKPRALSKGELFISEGDVPKKFAFVSQGLFRYSYLKSKGNEFTKNFIPEGNFIAAYSSMIAVKPSAMFIEALEDSMVFEINYADWMVLKDDHPCWNKFLVFFLEKAFTIKETREREFLLLDAQERYTIFKRDFPNLESRIKQHYIASYLGISPVSLSRLRKKVAVNIG